MKQRRFGQVDLDTGEIVTDGQLVYQPAKRRNGFQQGGWLAMAQNPVKQIAKTNIGGEAMRVFLLMCGELDFENWINLSQTAIANDLNMTPSHVSRAIARLKNEQIILEGPKVGRARTYRMNPAYGWKGSAKSHREALNARTAAAGLTVHQGGKS